MFDGVGSPLSQAFGLGLFAPASAGDLTTLEAFFHDRGADVFHEVSPLADASLLTLLPERGYRPVELTSVMHTRLAGSDQRPRAAVTSPLTARRIESGEESVWVAVARLGRDAGAGRVHARFRRRQRAERGHGVLRGRVAG